MPDVAILDYGAGNLHSVHHALDTLGATVHVTSHADEVASAERLVLPGVGAFGECAASLRRSGLIEALEDAVFRRGRPLLGICVGLQLMAREGHEMGVHPGLGWVDGIVRRLEPPEGTLKIPHVGWNEIIATRADPLFLGFGATPTFYFTHSYCLDLQGGADEVATCEYGEVFTAAIVHGNLSATQFHPEKSQENGLKLLENFLRWNP